MLTLYVDGPPYPATDSQRLHGSTSRHRFCPARFSASTDDSDRTLFNPFLYPVCNVVGHIHGTVLYDSAALPPASLANPDAHSSSVPPPHHVVECLTEVSPLDSFLSVHQTTTERSRIPVTSPPDHRWSNTRHRHLSYNSTLRHSRYFDTHSSSFLYIPTRRCCPPVQPDLLTPSDPPNLPVLASSDPVLDNIVLTGPSLPSHSPTTRPDLSCSFPESHRAIIAIASKHIL
ncbi:hypothetical protein EDB92DRAFT_1919332, partial [Lactarius akahatsu]